MIYSKRKEKIKITMYFLIQKCDFELFLGNTYYNKNENIHKSKAIRLSDKILN